MFDKKVMCVKLLKKIRIYLNIESSKTFHCVSSLLYFKKEKQNIYYNNKDELLGTIVFTTQ